jgi:Carboxypeptidase regulatory-like domain
MAFRLSIKRVSIFASFGVLAVIFLVSVPGHSQVAGATLIGTVTDPSGAVIPNAQVSITNTATGITTNVTTNSAGFYATPNLIPGPYQVTMRAEGFQTQIRSGITLTVGEQQVLNGALPLGQTSQTIEVSGEAATVELSSSTMSETVAETTVRELPLNGRDWTSLANLEPGVVPGQSRFRERSIR